MLIANNCQVLICFVPAQMQATEDGCEEDGAKKKWMCEYCTYSNWPSSTQCTMCRGNKPVSGTENIFSAVNNSNNQRGELVS